MRNTKGIIDEAKSGFKPTNVRRAAASDGARATLRPARLGSILHRMMANRLDLVTVGIAQERGVIRRMIVAQARRAVVGAAGGNPGMPERIDLASRLRLEAPMTAAGPVRLRPPVDGDVDAIGMLRVSPFAVAEPASLRPTLTMSSVFMIAS